MQSLRGRALPATVSSTSLNHESTRMTASKSPGWGLRILNVRNTTGIPEALILPADHEAPFWTDLREIAQHQARTIYQPR